jgi:proline dehydrogenase
MIDWAVRTSLPLLPRSVIWLVARRYVAGADLADALARISAVRADGYGAIIDVLGEGDGDRAEAEAAAKEYHQALAGLEGVDPECPISVKPTHLGLSVDEDLCRRLLSELCEAAAAAGRRVRFEMEDAPTIDGTLRVFSAVRSEFPNVGCVIQARLFRSADDIARLLEQGPGLDVRLVKGIYLEPESIAWTRHQDISDSFVRLAGQLIEGGARVALATHDGAVADACVELARNAGWCEAEPSERPYEFQLLMGVRADEAARLLGAGHRVRIYVPYGRDWHAYSMRRLAHNPEVARHVIRAFFRLR